MFFLTHIPKTEHCTTFGLPALISIKFVLNLSALMIYFSSPLSARHLLMWNFRNGQHQYSQLKESNDDFIFMNINFTKAKEYYLSPR